MSLKVSTIVPVYNGAQWLQSTVESLLAQSYPEHEIVLVDDGSSDDSLQLAQALAAQYPQILAISQTNGGVAAARNTGIRAASGELIALCDQDDLWMPGKLAAQVPLFSDTVGLVYSGIEFRYPDYAKKIVPRGRSVTLQDILRRNSISSCTVVARRDLVDQVGLFEPDRALMGVDDWHLWIKLLTRTQADYVPEVLATHIVHGDNYSFRELDMLSASIACIDNLGKEPLLTGYEDELKTAAFNVYDHYARNLIHYGQFAEAVKCISQKRRLKPFDLRTLAQALAFSTVPDGMLRYLQNLKRRIQQ